MNEETFDPKNKTMREIFLHHTGHTTFKWEHYLDAYDHELSRLRGLPLNVLEIGVARGGSLQVMSAFLGEKCTMHGVDINPNCKRYEEDRISVHIGSQVDADFLEELCQNYGPFDLIIDDGSHVVDHQIFTLEFLWPFLKTNGIYVCEDTHTSYFTRFGGGYNKSDSFVEHVKKKIDLLHMWWSGRMPKEETEKWTKTLKRVTYYPAVVFLEKANVEAPHVVWNENGEIRREPDKKLFFDAQEDPTG